MIKPEDCWNVFLESPLSPVSILQHEVQSEINMYWGPEWDRLFMGCRREDIIEYIEILAKLIAAERSHPSVINFTDEKCPEIFRNIMNIIRCSYRGETASKIEDVEPLLRNAYTHNNPEFVVVYRIISIAKKMRAGKIFTIALRHELSTEDINPLAFEEVLDICYTLENCIKTSIEHDDYPDEIWLDNLKLIKEIIAGCILKKKCLYIMTDKDGNPYIEDSKDDEYINVFLDEGTADELDVYIKKIYTVELFKIFREYSIDRICLIYNNAAADIYISEEELFDSMPECDEE